MCRLQTNRACLNARQWKRDTGCAQPTPAPPRRRVGAGATRTLTPMTTVIAPLILLPKVINFPELRALMNGFNFMFVFVRFGHVTVRLCVRVRAAQRAHHQQVDRRYLPRHLLHAQHCHSPFTTDHRPQSADRTCHCFMLTSTLQ